MRQTTAAIVRFEVNGDVHTAQAPILICQGECTGDIIHIPNHEWTEQEFETYLQELQRKDKKYIFSCDQIRGQLRKLIPHALGFIFGEGAALGHFSGIVHHHQIPACIDHSLFEFVKEKLVTGGDEKSGSFYCGREIAPGEKWFAQQKEHLRTYHATLQEQPLVIPAIDMNKLTPLAAVNAGKTRVGEKALAINALELQQMPTAKALILTNFQRGELEPSQEELIIKWVKQSLPTFGKTPNAKLISRGSYHFDREAHKSWSGLIASPTIFTQKMLIDTIKSQVDQWSTLCGSENDPQFSIILQERITTPVWGILGTGRRWDFDTDAIVVEFTIEHGDQGIETLLLSDDLRSGITPQAAKDIASKLVDSNLSLTPQEVTDILDQIIQKASFLRDQYGIPLEIEFVLTQDKNYTFVQFRPLFR